MSLLVRWTHYATYREADPDTSPLRHEWPLIVFESRGHVQTFSAG